MAPTAQDALAQWMRARAAAGQASPHTQTAYRRDVTAIVTEIARITQRDGNPMESILVTDFTTSTLRDAFADYAQGRSIATLARAQTTWRGFAGFCTAEGWLPGDPMAAVPKARAPRAAPKPFKGGDDTAVALIRHLATGPRSGKDPWRERDLAVITTLLTTGIRSAELRGLTRGDRYASGGDEYLRVLGKGHKERAVPLIPPLDNVLDAYEQSRQARFPGWHPKFADPLFVSVTNLALTADALRWLVQVALRDAGLSGAPQRQAFIHGFRHTAATQLASHGASATEIQALLGHASLATSQHYIQAVAREVRAAAAANPAYQALRELDSDR